jgi:G3E family GTPase
MLEAFRAPDASRFGRRLRRERGGKIPVVVVTGFLGAGKTTLIREFLDSPEGRHTAVVVNELGAVGIDDQLVRASADETVLLGNGCLCCVMRSDLQIALRRFVADRDRGALPWFARVLIETSGLADPSPILQTFSTDRALGAEFHLDLIATVVDGATGAATLGWSAEMRKQVILADRIIVTKTDLIDAAPAGALMRELRALNQRTDIQTAVNGALATKLLGEPPPVKPDRAAHGFAAEAVHSDGIVSFVLTDARPVAWGSFARAMETLVALRGADLLRVKGLLNVEGCAGPVVVQFVQHLAHPPVELDAWPDQDHSSRVVFITRNIAQHTVMNLFEAVDALTPRSSD